MGTEDVVARFEAVLNASGEFWVEAREHDSGIGWRLTVTDRETDAVYTVIVEDDDAGA